MALEESDLCQQLGIPTESIEQWLEKYLIEHSIRATLDGTESVGEWTLSLVRQSSGFGVRRPPTKRATGMRFDGYFQVRLFSPTALFDAEYTLKAAQVRRKQC